MFSEFVFLGGFEPFHEKGFLSFSRERIKSISLVALGWVSAERARAPVKRMTTSIYERFRDLEEYRTRLYRDHVWKDAFSISWPLTQGLKEGLTSFFSIGAYFPEPPLKPQSDIHKTDEHGHFHKGPYDRRKSRA